MIGAIIGDIAGSRFEFNNHRSKDFKFLHRRCEFTDDSVMTIALSQAILDCQGDYSCLRDHAITRMREFGTRYPDAGYGGGFFNWLFAAEPQPYNSCGNGAAMRVSAVGFAARTPEECKDMSRKVTEVTHNHPDGILGAEATAMAIFMARRGATIPQIRKVFTEQYYPIDFTLDGIRDSYKWGALCSNTVPQAMEAFFESTGYEDAIRSAISIGGDSDTIAAITGGVAEAYYGVPDELREQAMSYLTPDLREVILAYEKLFPLQKPDRPEEA